MNLKTRRTLYKELIEDSQEIRIVGPDAIDAFLDRIEEFDGSVSNESCYKALVIGVALHQEMDPEQKSRLIDLIEDPEVTQVADLVGIGYFIAETGEVPDMMETRRAAENIWIVPCKSPFGMPSTGEYSSQVPGGHSDFFMNPEREQIFKEVKNYLN